MILRAVQDSAVMRLSKLRAILGLTIVLTLCVYYPCQDAGAQRPCLRGRKLQFETRNDFEELCRSLLERKGLEIAAE